MKLFSWISRKLVRRLVASSLFLSLLAVMLLSFIAYYSVRENLRDSVAGRLHSVVDQQELEIKRWIEDQKKTAIFISRAPIIREKVADLLSRGKDHPYYENAYRYVSEYLFSYIKNFPGLREIMILSDRGGEVIFSTTSENEGAFREKDTFFRKGMDDLYVQGVYPWRQTAEPTITISRPLLGAFGNKAGVLAVHLNLERMDEVVNDHAGFGKTGEVYLVDQYSSFISARRFGREDFPRGIDTEGVDRAIAGEEGVAYYLNYEAIPVVGYYRWLPELEVAIIAEIRQSEAFSTARNIGIIIASGGAILSFFLVVGNIFFANQIAEPLEGMAKMAEQVAGGDFSIHFPETLKDETGILATSFNSMIRHLHSVYGKLENTAEHFRTVFNLSPYAIGVMRVDNGAFIDVNEGFCEIFNVSSERAVGRSPQDLKIWASDRDRLRLVSLLNRDGKVVDFEADFVRDNGERFRGLLSSRRVELSGRPHNISILIDISPLRKTERDLRRTTERLQLLLNRMPVGCITWSVDPGVGLWNPEAESIFGYSASEAVGRHAYDLVVHAEEQPRFAGDWKKLKSRDETLQQESANITSDGRRIICDWYHTPLKNDRGELIGVISMVRDITAKRKAEEDLKYQKELLQTILNSIPTPIFYKDVDGYYRGCNKAFCQYVGFNHEELVGHHVRELFPAEKAEVYDEADRKLLEEGGTQIYEAKVRFADGSDRDVVFHKAIYRNPDGSTGGLVGNMIDVTEIRKAEAELAESEQNYREIFNASTEAIVIRDAKDGSIIDVNQAMLDMYGYSRDEAIDVDIGALASGEAPYVKKNLLQHIELAKDGIPQLFEWQAKKKDGTRFWVEISLKRSVIRGQDRLLAVIRDISERREAEQAQRESEERFHLLIEHAADALYLHDKDGCILTVNQRVCDSLGYSREELIGMNVETLCDDLSGEELRAFWASLEIGKSAVLEVTVRAKDGKLYPNDVNIGRFAFHDAEFYLAMARDVSERKAAEAELERYRNRLEELVTERTRQLEQAQSELVQKERMAVLGQLTATVSHELRNPLGTVKNAIYLLSRIDPIDTGGAQMEKALGLADRNVRRCDGIINELLDYSRQQDLSPVATDISALVAEVLDEQNIPDGIKLTRNLKKGVIAPCDPERLRRAIINVLTNSIQALEEESGRKGLLKVQVRQQKERSEIAVSDNGPGIDEAIREKIFEPMFSTKNFGVGLGMPIVKNIMEEHGGDIEIESTPGQGTTVTLWLPHVYA